MRLDLVLKVVVFTGLLGITNLALAQASDITLKLKTLEVVQQQEEGGDELYISVTEFPSKGKPLHYQVPSFPTHWLSKYLTNVKDIILWKKSSEACEPADLLITLVEEDLVPWNMDDSLGSIELKVECQNGKAVQKWVTTDQRTANKLLDKEGVFTFDGQGAKYRAEFSLESK